MDRNPLLEFPEDEGPSVRWVLAAIVVGLVCFGLLFGCSPAHAASIYVNIACPTDGTGAVPECGPTGPRRSIQAAVTAAQCGDDVRIASGRYFEHVEIDKRCAGNRVRILGDVVPSRPIVAAWREHTDWAPLGGNCWRRTMEAGLNPDSTFSGLDQWNPAMLFEASVGPARWMGYDTAATALPARGRWRYNAADHTVTVCPILAIENVRVPHDGHALRMPAGAGGVVVSNLVIEHPRSKGFMFGRPNQPADDVEISNVVCDGYPSMCFHGHTTPRLRLTGNQAFNGCRGLSVPSRGCFSARLFTATGAVIEGNRFGDCGTAPWLAGATVPADTAIAAYCTPIDVKTTFGAIIERNLIQNYPPQCGIRLDRAQVAMARFNTVTNGGMGICSGSSSPIDYPAGWDGAMNVVMEGNTVTNMHAGSEYSVSDQMDPDADFWVHFRDNTPPCASETCDCPGYQTPNSEAIDCRDGGGTTTLFSTTTSCTTSTLSSTTVPSTTSSSTTVTTSTLPAETTSTSRPPTSTSSTTSSSTTTTSTSRPPTTTVPTTTVTTHPPPTTPTTTLPRTVDYDSKCLVAGETARAWRRGRYVPVVCRKNWFGKLRWLEPKKQK